MNAAVRQFQASPGVRKAGGLLVSIVGPSSSGKTLSALKLAAGIRSVCGGEIDLIDTENRRALAYADKYKFNHVPFDPPFSPDDYWEVIKYCVIERGTKTVIVDQTSFEHEGVGGVLEWHEREIERLLKQWRDSTRDKVQMAAWQAPKAARTRLINEIQRMNTNLIFTFRAKEKIKIVPGKPPKDLGWQAVSGDEWMYAMSLQFLLTPGSDGRPTWQSDLPSERAVMKLPLQFREMFSRESPAQLDEEAGRKIAEWAAGSAAMPTDALGFLQRYTDCASQQDFDDLEKARGAIWKSIPTGEKPRVKDAAEAAKARLTPTARINFDQATVLADAIKEEGVELSLVLAKLEIGALEDLPANKYDEAKAFIDATSAA